MKLWHGGQRGLARGSLILPPCKTGARDTIADFAERVQGKLWDREHVYLTSSFDAALFYAVLHPSAGWVYECEPIGELGEDPDCHEPGLSFRCAEARIVTITVPNKWQRRDVKRAAEAMVLR